MANQKISELSSLQSGSVSVPNDVLAIVDASGNTTNKIDVKNLKGAIRGASNSDIGNCATVGGGDSNTASNACSTVSGGYSNTTSGDYATVGGGYSNTAEGEHATVSGGCENSAPNTYSTVGGGGRNDADGESSTVSGGYCNCASCGYSTIGGGCENTTSGDYATVGGGYSNTAEGDSSTVGGGGNNTAGGATSTVGGGYNNCADGDYSTVGGGYCNYTYAEYSTIVGGYENRINENSSYSTIQGSANEITDSACSSITGYDNEITSDIALGEIDSTENNHIIGFCNKIRTEMATTGSSLYEGSEPLLNNNVNIGSYNTLDGRLYFSGSDQYIYNDGVSNNILIGQDLTASFISCTSYGNDDYYGNKGLNSNTIIGSGYISASVPNLSNSSSIEHFLCNNLILNNACLECNEGVICYNNGININTCVYDTYLDNVTTRNNFLAQGSQITVNNRGFDGERYTYIDDNIMLGTCQYMCSDVCGSACLKGNNLMGKSNFISLQDLYNEVGSVRSACYNTLLGYNNEITLNDIPSVDAGKNALIGYCNNIQFKSVGAEGDQVTQIGGDNNSACYNFMLGAENCIRLCMDYEGGYLQNSYMQKNLLLGYGNEFEIRTKGCAVYEESAHNNIIGCENCIVTNVELSSNSDNLDNPASFRHCYVYTCNNVLMGEDNRIFQDIESLYVSGGEGIGITPTICYATARNNFLLGCNQHVCQNKRHVTNLVESEQKRNILIGHENNVCNCTYNIATTGSWTECYVYQISNKILGTENCVNIRINSYEGEGECYSTFDLYQVGASNNNIVGNDNSINFCADRVKNSYIGYSGASANSIFGFENSILNQPYCCDYDNFLSGSITYDYVSRNILLGDNNSICQVVNYCAYVSYNDILGKDNNISNLYTYCAYVNYNTQIGKNNNMKIEGTYSGAEDYCSLTYNTCMCYNMQMGYNNEIIIEGVYCESEANHNSIIGGCNELCITTECEIEYSGCGNWNSITGKSNSICIKGICTSGAEECAIGTVSYNNIMGYCNGLKVYTYGSTNSMCNNTLIGAYNGLTTYAYDTSVTYNFLMGYCNEICNGLGGAVMEGAYICDNDINHNMLLGYRNRIDILRGCDSTISYNFILGSDNLISSSVAVDDTNVNYSVMLGSYNVVDGNGNGTDFQGHILGSYNTVRDNVIEGNTMEFASIIGKNNCATHASSSIMGHNICTRASSSLHVNNILLETGSIPTSDPGIPGMLFIAGGALKVSGCIA